MTEPASVLFHLLRIALGNERNYYLTDGVDWKGVMDLSVEQGVAAIAFDGLQKIYNHVKNYNAKSGCESVEIERTIAVLDSLKLENVKYDWLGMQVTMEQEYVRHVMAIADLAKFYESKSIRMLLLKGYGLSLNYPLPSHRPCGDIDIYNFGQWKRADDEVRKNVGVEVDDSHEHHTVFGFEGQMVENHYDIINTKGHRSSRGIDAKLKTLALNSKESMVRYGKFFLPSPDFNAVFIIRHMGQHFAGAKITMRHLLDWGLFIDRHSEEINWNFIIPYWKEIGISTFAGCVNTICVEQLGIDERKFQGQLSSDGILVDRVLNDIVSPEFCEKKPCGHIFKVVAFKTRRFFANSWKQQLVYKEKVLESFFTGSIAHLKRFSTIKD